MSPIRPVAVLGFLLGLAVAAGPVTASAPQSLSIEPDPGNAEPNWTCGGTSVDEGGPAAGQLNEALFRPIHDFYATLADGSTVRIGKLTVRFRNAVGRYNELAIHRKKSAPQRLEWHMNGVKLAPGPARSVCELPHELLQRISRQGEKKVLMQAVLWEGGQTRRVTRATIDYESADEEPRNAR